jgi:hypothetical protein
MYEFATVVYIDSSPMAGHLARRKSGVQKDGRGLLCSLAEGAEDGHRRLREAVDRSRGA